MHQNQITFKFLLYVFIYYEASFIYFRIYVLDFRDFYKAHNPFPQCFNAIRCF